MPNNIPGQNEKFEYPARIGTASPATRSMMKEKLLVQRLALEKDDAVGVDLSATLTYLSTLNIIMIETGRHAGLPLRMYGPMISTVDAAGWYQRI